MLRIACLIFALTMLAACSSHRWTPPTVGSPEDRVVEERVRAPSAGSDNELQVFGMRNQAVAALGREAEAAEQAGDRERAMQLLERALRIDGRDAEILQHMAELHLAEGRLDQAGSFAARAYDLGPKVGDICRRSLNTLMVVRERTGEWDQAWGAYSELSKCRVAPPERF